MRKPGNNNTETIIVEVDVKGDTDKAVFVEICNSGEEMWLPKSQVHIYKQGMKEVCSIPIWLAKERDIEA